jgi:predicted thioredoxin/glutaredoxin
MKNVIVLGSGCTKCVKTAEYIEKVAADLGVECSVTKETSPQVIMSYKVMSTPAVVVDGVLVHSGSIPLREQIQHWLNG